MLHQRRHTRFSLPALALTAVLLSWVLLAGLARAQGEVNIYSYRQPFLIEPMLEAFTEQTGIRTNVVFAPQGMVERLKQEGMNSPADVVLTVDIGRIHDAATAGVLQPVKTPTLTRNIPEQYRHPDGLWYALTLRSRAIYASKERVPREELTSYEALMAPQWEGRICVRSSSNVYNIALLASIIAHHGTSFAEQWAAGVHDNLARRPQGNDRAQVAAIAEGECDVALVNTYYRGAMMDDPDQVPAAEATYTFFPNQSGRGAHMNISAGAVTKAAPNRDNAVALLEFLSGEEAQHMYAEINDEYPVKPGVEWSERVRSWGGFKADPLPLQAIAENREEAIRIFDRVGFP